MAGTSARSASGLYLGFPSRRKRETRSSQNGWAGESGATRASRLHRSSIYAPGDIAHGGRSDTASISIAPYLMPPHPLAL
eukprot:2562451-Pyramimonas_sp.AAC.1